MGKEAASRSLNYALPQHILDRVARTTESDVFAKNNAASAISTAGQGLAKNLETQELAKRKEVKLEKEKDDLIRETALENFNVGIDKLGHRGDAVDPLDWDRKYAIENTLRDEFINADPSEHASLLRDQKTRSASHTRNRESLKLVTDAHLDKNLDLDSMSGEQLHMIGVLAGGEGESMLNEHNEYEWQYRPIGWKEGDELATATSRDVEKLMEEHMLPHAEQVEFEKALAGVASASEKNPDNPYNSKVVYNTAKDIIKSGNIKQLLTNGDVWGSQGESFSDHFLEWKGFDNMELDLQYQVGTDIGMEKLDPNSDGVFTKEELSKADRKAVIGLLGEEENHDLAKELLLDYAVERGRLQHQGAVDVAAIKRERIQENQKNKGGKGGGGGKGSKSDLNSVGLNSDDTIFALNFEGQSSYVKGRDIENTAATFKNIEAAGRPATFTAYNGETYSYQDGEWWSYMGGNSEEDKIKVGRNTVINDLKWSTMPGVLELINADRANDTSRFNKQNTSTPGDNSFGTGGVASKAPADFVKAVARDDKDVIEWFKGKYPNITVEEATGLDKVKFTIGDKSKTFSVDPWGSDQKRANGIWKWLFDNNR